MNNMERLSLIMILAMLLAGCDASNQAPLSLPQPSSQASPQSDTSGLASPAQEPPASKVLQEDKSHIFLERDADATDIVSEPASHTEFEPEPTNEDFEVDYEILFDDNWPRTLSITFSDGENYLICDNYPARFCESADKRKIAYLSNYEFETRAELNIFDVEIKQNCQIEIDDFLQDETIQRIDWYNNEYLLFSKGYMYGTRNYANQLYSLNVNDMAVKKLAVCKDSGIYDLTDGKLTMINNIDDNSAFIYTDTSVCYSLVNNKTDNKVEEIIFKPSPADVINVDYLHSCGLYQRMTKPYFLHPQKENELYALSPYAIGEFLDWNPNRETGVIPSETGRFFGFTEDWEPCGLWCGLGVEASASATSTLRAQGEHSYEIENALMPYSPDRDSCWSEGVAGYGIGEGFAMNIKYYGSGSYSYEKYISNELDERGFPLKDGHSNDNCVFFYTNMCIVNGYAKDETLWRENSRIKTMKFYVDGDLYGIIHLEDTIKPQYLPLYNIPAQPEKEMEFSFEITEVYPGDKYDDTCLTGVNLSFRGIGGHGHGD